MADEQQMTRQRKLRMFGSFMDSECPGCGGDKTRLHHLCEPCQQRVSRSELNTRLTETCAAHVVAAENLIALAKATKP